MIRILIADDQIPADNLPDSEVIEWARTKYPNARKGFHNAFAVMRQAVNTLRDGCDVTVANRYSDALKKIEQEKFDIAIIDLGWTGDFDVSREKARSAGWQLIDAIKKEDTKHPERQPTEQIVYSSRFESHPDLGQEAAAHGALPFYKPYGERFSLLLEEEEPEPLNRMDRIRVACESLKGAVKFVEHLRARRVERILKSTEDGLASASNRERQWNHLTFTMVTIGILAVFAGIVMSLFVGLEEGVVSSTSGIMIAIIPKLLYKRLDVIYAQLKDARKELVDVLKEIRG